MDTMITMDASMESDSDSSVGSEEMRDLEILRAVAEDVLVARPRLNEKQLKDREAVQATIAVNRKLQNLYKNLEDMLTKRLKECHQKLEENAKLKASLTLKVKKFRYQTCGKPYFKDRNMDPPPDNQDTIVMKQLGMYDFNNTLIVTGWTVRDKSLFVNLLHEMSVNIRRKQLEKKISTLELEKKKKNLKEIAFLKKQINNLKQMSLEQLALPIEQDYDWEEIAEKLQRHTPQEYKALWQIFLHPSVNKGHWSTEEHQNLQRLALEHNRQDWDTIAAKLNTRRTAYQCFVYFRTNITEHNTGRKWTHEEIEYLKRLVDFYKEDNYIPWGSVANAFENRTKMQVYNKYQRVVEQRKGRFFPEEDSVILNFVNAHGLNFKKMTDYLPGRSGTQLRIRYNLLNKMKLSTTWTLEEDRKLLEIMANQDSSSNFSMVTPYFPDKDRSHIRSRYITLKKWMKNHPQADLSAAPRRGARRLQHGRPHVDLNQSLEALVGKMETQINKIKEKKKKISDMSEEDLEECIMAFLYNEMLKREAAENADKRGITASAQDTAEPVQQNTESLDMENVKNLLILMGASLNKFKFTSSTEADQYPGLTEESKNVSQLSTYSKKELVRTFEVKEKPDIWGGNKHSRIVSVMPPNLSTLTACRVIMNLTGFEFGSRKVSKVNVSQMTRDNAILREQMKLLKQRFKILFLWPILLSNRSPATEVQEVFDSDRPSTSKDTTMYSKFTDSDSSANETGTR